MNLINDFFEKYYKDYSYELIVADFKNLNRMLDQIITSIVCNIEYPNTETTDPLIINRINELREKTIVKGFLFNQIKGDYEQSINEYPITTIGVMMNGKTLSVEVVVNRDGTLRLPFDSKYFYLDVITQIEDYNDLIRNKHISPIYKYYEELLKPFENKKLQ